MWISQGMVEQNSTVYLVHYIYSLECAELAIEKEC